MAKYDHKTIINVITTLTALIITPLASALAPTQKDIDVYSSACNIGSVGKQDIGLEIGVISRLFIKGPIKLSKSDLEKEFPNIKDEKNRLLALDAYQDCMFRYVSTFHVDNTSNSPQDAQNQQHLLFAPEIPEERKRELIYLANQLENFKNRMTVAKAKIPEKYYDKRDATNKFPRSDERLIDIETYNNYKAFNSPSRIPDFSKMTNNDVVLLCDAFESEVSSYASFRRSFSVLKLNSYHISHETSRICKSARRGR